MPTPAPPPYQGMIHPWSPALAPYLSKQVEFDPAYLYSTTPEAIREREDYHRQMAALVFAPPPDRKNLRWPGAPGRERRVRLPIGDIRTPPAGRMTIELPEDDQQAPQAFAAPLLFTEQANPAIVAGIANMDAGAAAPASQETWILGHGHGLGMFAPAHGGFTPSTHGN